MPIASSQQYATMLDRAAAGGYALPSVNVTSSQTLNGALRGFADAGSDGIVQVSTGSGTYLSGPGQDMAIGARALAEFAHVVAERSPVLVGLHTDHAPPDAFDTFVRPLVEETKRRVERGQQPLFNSHMFDGSTLPLEENLRMSRDLLDELSRLGLVLEIEVGVVGGEEDGIRGPEGPDTRLYTTTADLLRVAEVLGTGDRGRYLLAATFGNVHGVYQPGHVQLRPQILADGQQALARAHGEGARFEYVFHGSSGSSREDLEAAVRYGVVKVNVDTDGQYAFTRAVADHVLKNYDGVLHVDGGVGHKSAYDPRSWGRKGEASLAERIAEAAEVLGSAGNSLTR